MDSELRDLHRGAEREQRRLADTNPHLVTVSCEGCRKTVEMPESAASAASRNDEPTRCDDCRKGNVSPDEYVSRERCENCERETPHRSHQNPAATWVSCVVCGYTEDV